MLTYREAEILAKELEMSEDKSTAEKAVEGMGEEKKAYMVQIRTVHFFVTREIYREWLSHTEKSSQHPGFKNNMIQNKEAEIVRHLQEGLTRSQYKVDVLDAGDIAKMAEQVEAEKKGAEDAENSQKDVSESPSPEAGGADAGKSEV